jgi:hypothetical protein
MNCPFLALEPSSDVIDLTVEGTARSPTPLLDEPIEPTASSYSPAAASDTFSHHSARQSPIDYTVAE